MGFCLVPASVDPGNGRRRVQRDGLQLDILGRVDVVGIGRGEEGGLGKEGLWVCVRAPSQPLGAGGGYRGAANMERDMVIIL